MQNGACRRYSGCRQALFSSKRSSIESAFDAAAFADGVRMFTTAVSDRISRFKLVAHKPQQKSPTFFVGDFYVIR